MRPGEAMPPLARTVAMSRTFCPDSQALVVLSSARAPALLRSGGFTGGLLPPFWHNRIYVKEFLTHAEYDKGRWKKWL
jgi:hypothetical protein